MMISATPESESRASQPPYLMYGGIVVAIILARWLQIAAQQLGWTKALTEGPTFLLFMAIALFVSIVTWIWFRRRTAKLLTFLLCGLSGAIATVVADPLPGAIVGFATGGVGVAAECLLGREANSVGMAGIVKRLGPPILRLTLSCVATIGVAWLVGAGFRMALASLGYTGSASLVPHRSPCRTDCGGARHSRGKLDETRPPRLEVAPADAGSGPVPCGSCLGSWRNALTRRHARFASTFRR